ncbi:hypothetical protein YC2023_009037 [Brassica napus]
MGTGSGALVKRISLARFETISVDNKKLFRDIIIVRKGMYRENLRKNNRGHPTTSR